MEIEVSHLHRDLCCNESKSGGDGGGARFLRVLSQTQKENNLSLETHRDSVLAAQRHKKPASQRRRMPAGYRDSVQLHNITPSLCIA